MTATAARRGAFVAARLRIFSGLVRFGFAARALTYGLIGGVSLALAFGAGRAPVAPNQQGALALVARAPLGRIVVFAIAVGLMSYAIWKLGQGLFGRGPEGGGGLRPFDRLANTGGGLAYLVFFAVAVNVLVGTDSGDSNAPRDTAAGVLGWPGGPVFVGIAGVAMLLISLYQMRDGLRLGFVRDNKTEGMGVEEREVFVVLGRIGLVARALVFALVGYFLLRTAIGYDAAHTVGIDGALYRVYEEPYGPWLMGTVAVGLLIFAAFSLLEGRHRRL
ncbi:MAG TPA: DUF1206 domain-containing protein [Solirubrobacteraceae bacterium]|jgi:hypothetical protein